jgi:hypothetical protein
MDMDDLKETVERELEDTWEHLADGAKEDVSRFAGRMATNLTEAIAHGDVARVEEIREQGRALAESYRVRLNESAWGLLLKGIKLAVTIAAA